MSNAYFVRLASYIQEFIYKKKWDRFSEVQIQAGRVLLDTSHHVLLCAGTSSGKTEAALFPTLTQLDKYPSSSIGILYISPLKALINDQHERIRDLLQEANLPVWHWHGDVSQYRKQQVMKNPVGILQITPESLEGLLMNNPTMIRSLFHDLRFLIIDEVHAFMGTDRGTQVQCQWERIQRIAGCEPRRIGLSATLNDYEVAKDWLGAGSSRPVEVVAVAGKRKIKLRVEHFYIPDEVIALGSAARQDYYNFIYDSTHTKKAIVFTNSRSDAEVTTLELRKIAAARLHPDVFHVHHGSLSKLMRDEAESALRTGTGPAVTTATLTLELGLDLGDLERVVQLNAPYSASSFVQRLGRSGRRHGLPSEMVFVCPEPVHDEPNELDEVPWMLLRTIAIIELYIRNRWVEPIVSRSLPIGVLYQQTMSILKSYLECTPKILAQAVLSLPAFKHVTPEQFKQLLRHLIAIDHIQLTEEKSLIIGFAGERIANHFRFYGVFQEDEEFSVYCANELLGTITEIPPLRFVFTLAGRMWMVLDINYTMKVVYVQPAKGRSETLWTGKGGDIHNRVVSKMREVLADRASYSYLSPRASDRLERARRDAVERGWLEHCLIQGDGGEWYLVPWLGSKAFRTLERMLRFQVAKQLKIASVVAVEPHYFIIQGDLEQNELLDILLHAGLSNNAEELIMDENKENLWLGKYDEYAPLDLIQKAFIADGLDVEGMTNSIQKYKKAFMASGQF